VGDHAHHAAGPTNSPGSVDRPGRIAAGTRAGGTREGEEAPAVGTLGAI
jgi:hypothetical protein